MATKSFKDLKVWQQASDFSIDLYKALSDNKDYGFRDQIQRAALSIPNNIAEGYARRSDKALRNFLQIAKGSAAEVESMLLISVKLGYLDTKEHAMLSREVEEIGKQLSGFIKSL